MYSIEYIVNFKSLMKMKKLILILILGIVSLPFVSCKKEGCTDKNALNYNDKAKKNDKSCKYPIPTGGLIVYVENYIGNPVKGREVWLYTNETDLNNANPYRVLTTDNNGKVQFDGLTSGVYWVDCLFYDVFGNGIIAEGNASVTNGYVTTVTIAP